MKLLLKEWKAQLYQEADRERLAKLAQLGDEDAAAELQRQDSRKGELSPEEIVKRIAANHGAELANYRNAKLVDSNIVVTRKPDTGEVFVVKVPLILDSKVFVIRIQFSDKAASFVVARWFPDRRAYAKFYDSRLESFNWQDAFEESLLKLKDKLRFDKAEDNYLDRE